MKKFFKLLTVNIICICICWIACDYIIYKQALKTTKQRLLLDYPHQPFKYRIEPFYAYSINSYYNGQENNIHAGRKPDGLEYKNNNPPITIFGCSFAHGQYLKQNQTFSYKLSQTLKCPVYNRAIPGKGLAQMYQQSTLGRFYKDVPPSDTVIYVMIDDHYRRIKLSYIELLDDYILVNYRKKGNKLEEINLNNPIKMLFNSSYTVKWIRSFLVHNYIHNPKNAEKLTDEVLLYFIETRNNLKQKWNKDFKFVVIFYFTVSYSKLLKDKLEENGFIVIDIDKDFNLGSLYTDEYTISPQNKHPNEKAWDILTPLVVERLHLK